MGGKHRENVAVCVFGCSPCLFSHIPPRWHLTYAVSYHPQNLDILAPLFTVFAANRPVVPCCPAFASLDDDKYAAVASSKRYGAYVRLQDGYVLDIMRGGYGYLRHSA